ncbi:hypothetical protein M8J76_003479 [Diaphorina citri]|nr:hypothetical protein M8J76_003479 [Diaphorina citri]
MEENHNTDAKESFLQKDSTNNGTETEKQVRYGTRSACSQIMVAVVQNFLLIAVGMSFGMPTVIVGALDHKVATNQTKMESPNLIMSDEESSWYSVYVFGFLVMGCYPYHGCYCPKFSLCQSVV